MKSLLPFLLFVPLLILAKAESSIEADQQDLCIECHRKEWVEYRRSRMAVAARTSTFLEEWVIKGKDTRCFDCHAPSGQSGVACIDCHGTGDHPFPTLEVPQICARCHDAPGESTLRSYRRSPAARQGKDCLDCHLEGERTSHDFKGPSRPGFLERVARLGISVRRDETGYTALVRVRHKAGHALPGGTTGRAVWLIVEQLARDGNPIRKSQFRFGWYHDSEMDWQEQTLPPGPGTIIEVPLSDGETPSTVHAKLIYRFLPGDLERFDPDQVTLAQARFDFPGK